MRRYGQPYNGKRYLVNTNESSKEIHDLDNESPNCQINEIKKIHIVMLDTEAEVKRYILNNPGFNGCYWCLRKYHTG